MIIAKTAHALCYKGVHPRLDRALELLSDEAFINSVGTEPTELEGKALYAFRCDYSTVAHEETFFEAHKKYLDIQMVISGRECCEIADPAGLGEPFEQRGDFWGYHGEAEQSVILRPGNFMVVFPGDAHRLKICVDKPEAVSKIVFKILVNEKEA